MPLPILLLVLLAACLHAGWNYLAKSSHDTVAFLWWGVAIGAAGYGAWLLATGSIFLPAELWPFFLLSDLAELGYFVALVRGYGEGDLSLVYPISRGSAPIFLPVWSALFLGERLPLGGYVGILLMVAGIVVASVRSSNGVGIDARERAAARSPAGFGAGLFTSPVLWALASGFFISIYSLSDKIIVTRMPPLVYNWWVYAGNTLTWLPVVWTAGRRSANFAEIRSNWPRIIAGSAMTVGAYVAVLVALTAASASYVVAGRGTSVIVGALLGWLALNESFGRDRVAGAVLMVAGLVVITFAR